MEMRVLAQLLEIVWLEGCGGVGYTVIVNFDSRIHSV
jgi:hypothetical protein